MSPGRITPLQRDGRSSRDFAGRLRPMTLRARPLSAPSPIYRRSSPNPSLGSTDLAMCVSEREPERNSRPSARAHANSCNHMPVPDEDFGHADTGGVTFHWLGFSHPPTARCRRRRIARARRIKPLPCCCSQAPGTSPGPRQRRCGPCAAWAPQRPLLPHSCCYLNAVS